MKKLFLIFVILLHVILGYSQIISPDKDYRNVGSAKVLNGKTYVLVLFVSSNYSTEWTQTEMDDVYRKIYQSFSWLKESALQYNSDVDFSLFVLGNNEKIIMDYIPKGPFEGKYSTDLLKKAMNAAGYDDFFDFEAYAHEKINSDNCVVYVCCNNYGRSYALPKNLSLSNYYKTYGINRDYLEGCVLYKNYTDGTPLNSASIAHETLHLFGAADLYDVYGGSNSQKDKYMQSYFPKSIMRKVPNNIYEAEIDNLTAFLVGISSSYESWYDYFLQ